MSIRAATLALTPIVYWPLDDTNSAIAADASGNGHTANFLNSVALGAPGPEPGTTCLAGSASNAGAQLAGTNPIIGTGNQSVVVWFAGTSLTSSNLVLIYNGLSNSTGLGLVLIGTALGDLVGGIGGASSGWALSSGFWHMCAGVCDTGHVYKMYGDGVLRSTSGSFAFNAVVGGNPMLAQTPDPGLLAHAAFFNYALTGAQVSSIWTAGPGSVAAPPITGRNATDADVLALETKLDTILASVRQTY